jgi:hypothetical protein
LMNRYVPSIGQTTRLFTMNRRTSRYEECMEAA